MKNEFCSICGMLVGAGICMCPDPSMNSPVTPPQGDAREKLLPCPFCGGDASFARGQQSTLTKCGCHQCQIWLHAIEWNIRAQSHTPSPTDEARELAHALKQDADALMPGQPLDDEDRYNMMERVRRASEILSRLPGEEATEEMILALIKARKMLVVLYDNNTDRQVIVPIVEKLQHLESALRARKGGQT